jgi:TRAP-type C4-dicarboxylate transport system permease small subunit
MTAFLRRTAHVLGVFSHIALWVSGAGLVAMTAAIAYQVFGRFVLNDTPSWTEPVSLLLMLYFILLAAAVGVRERFHLGLDLFRQIAPEPVRRAFDAVTHVVVGGFGIAMAWYGAGLARSTWAAPMPVLGLPEGLSYLPISLAGGLIALFSLEHLLLLAAGEPDVADPMAKAEAVLGE